MRHGWSHQSQCRPESEQGPGTLVLCLGLSPQVVRLSWKSPSDRTVVSSHLEDQRARQRSLLRRLSSRRRGSRGAFWAVGPSGPWGLLGRGAFWAVGPSGPWGLLGRGAFWALGRASLEARAARPSALGERDAARAPLSLSVDRRDLDRDGRMLATVAAERFGMRVRRRRVRGPCRSWEDGGRCLSSRSRWWRCRPPTAARAKVRQPALSPPAVSRAPISQRAGSSNEL